MEHDWCYVLDLGVRESLFGPPGETCTRESGIGCISISLENTEVPCSPFPIGSSVYLPQKLKSRDSWAKARCQQF